ncbi:unnamed protein product [Cyprideis torosa]|uniref:Uncharacterized protein n=1 Tax=Cyprideis torosa TaxID=163714 RepID=A0A7R8WEG5_9CRUS|nr:unnamed protein product [Cyprideis torosa]CAG0895783.1 unnamed protein product [Cyprideis torosa]
MSIGRGFMPGGRGSVKFSCDIPQMPSGTFPPASVPHPDEEAGRSCAEGDLKASAHAQKRKRLAITALIFLIFLAATVCILLITVYLLSGGQKLQIYSSRTDGVFQTAVQTVRPATMGPPYTIVNGHQGAPPTDANSGRAPVDTFAIFAEDSSVTCAPGKVLFMNRCRTAVIVDET